MNDQTTDLKALRKQAASAAINALGGPVESARKVLGDAKKYQLIQSWREAGVPVRYCRAVSSLSGMSLQELRPDDWADYWPTAKRRKSATTQA